MELPGRAFFLLSEDHKLTLWQLKLIGIISNRPHIPFNKANKNELLRLRPGDHKSSICVSKSPQIAHKSPQSDGHPPPRQGEWRLGRQNEVEDVQGDVPYRVRCSSSVFGDLSLRGRFTGRDFPCPVHPPTLSSFDASPAGLLISIPGAHK